MTIAVNGRQTAGTSSHLRQEEASPPARDVQAVHGVTASPPHQAVCARVLSDSLIPEDLVEKLRDYEWFAQDLYESAVQAAQGIELARRREEPRIERLMSGALVDIFHKDRATRGASFGKEGPLTQTDLPCPSNHKIEFNRIQDWTAGIPLEVIGQINRVLDHAPPDSWKWVTYSAASYTRPYLDPVIYALYGTWYVEVARW